MPHAETSQSSLIFYQTTAVTRHLKAVLAEGELSAAATCKNYLQVRTEGAMDGHSVVKDSFTTESRDNYSAVRFCNCYRIIAKDPRAGCEYWTPSNPNEARFTYTTNVAEDQPPVVPGH